MKINLAENMLRFGVKNLNTTATKKLENLAEQAATTNPKSNTQQGARRDYGYGELMSKKNTTLNAAPKADIKADPSGVDYNTYRNRMWIIVYGSLIVHQADVYLKNSFTYYYKGEHKNPKTVYANFANLKLPQEWINQSRNEFDTEFKTRFNKLMQDPKWLYYFAGEFNNIFGTSVEKPSKTVVNIQTYIKNQLDKTKYKNLVVNNGTVGEQFADGVWGGISTKAWLTYVIQNISPFDTIISHLEDKQTKSTNNKTKE